MGGGISKLVRGWRLIPQTGGRWKVGPQQLLEMGGCDAGTHPILVLLITRLGIFI